MWLRKIEEWIVIVLLATLVLLVFVSACFRYFDVSVTWSIEIAQLLFAWVCFVGADLTLRSNRHIGVDVLFRKFPARSQTAILLLLNVLIVAFLAIALYYGTQLSLQDYQRKFNTVAISYSWVTLSVPVGALLLGMTAVGRIVQNIKDLSGLTHLNAPKPSDDTTGAR